MAFSRFQIIHGVYLRSSGESLRGNSFYTAKNESEQAELDGLCLKGTCKNVSLPVAPKAAPAEVAPPAADDLASVPGVGKTVLDKLSKLGITTRPELKKAIDTRLEELNAALGESKVTQLKQGLAD